MDGEASPAAVIGRELASGERLLWSGRPQAGVLFRASDAFLVPFSLLWCGFAVFWEISAIRGGTPFFFRLFGVPFVLFGLYLVFGRFLADAWQRGRTFYGVTDRSVILVTAGARRTVKRLALRTMSDVSLQEGTGGRGTITFGPAPPFHSWFGGGGWPKSGHAAVPCFERIENPRTVYDLITGAQRDA